MTFEKLDDIRISKDIRISRKFVAFSWCRLIERLLTSHVVCKQFLDITGRYARVLWLASRIDRRYHAVDKLRALPLGTFNLKINLVFHGQPM